MRTILNTMLFLGLLSLLLFGLCIVAHAEDIELEQELFYKIWENESLYPFLSHYLNVAEKGSESYASIDRIEHDSFLTAVLESYAGDDAGQVSPEKIEINLRQAMQVTLFEE